MTQLGTFERVPASTVNRVRANPEGCGLASYTRPILLVDRF